MLLKKYVDLQIATFCGFDTYRIALVKHINTFLPILSGVSRDVFNLFVKRPSVLLMKCYLCCVYSTYFSSLQEFIKLARKLVFRLVVNHQYKYDLVTDLSDNVHTSARS